MNKELQELKRYCEACAGFITDEDSENDRFARMAYKDVVSKIEAIDSKYSSNELCEVMKAETGEKQCNLPVVAQQCELLAFKDWWNNLPDEHDDRLYITNETIDRFKKANYD